MPKTAPTKARAPRARRPKDDAQPPVRTVDGHTVVEVKPVKSGLPGKDGAGVALRMNELVLDDGTSRFDCADCGTVETSRGLMMRHRVATHTTKPLGRPKTASAGLPTSVRAMTLGSLVDLAIQADTTGAMLSTLTEQVLAERARANTAEGALRRLRAALGRAGFQLAEADA